MLYDHFQETSLNTAGMHLLPSSFLPPSCWLEYSNVGITDGAYAASLDHELEGLC